MPSFHVKLYYYNTVVVNLVYIYVKYFIDNITKQDKTNNHKESDFQDLNDDMKPRESQASAEDVYMNETVDGKSLDIERWENTQR